MTYTWGADGVTDFCGENGGQCLRSIVRAGSFGLGSAQLGRGEEFEALAPRCWALGSGF